MDLHLDPYTLGPPQGPNLLIPDMNVRAAYRLQNVDGVDHLKVCYPMHGTDARPTNFNEPEGADDPRILSMVRADRSFVNFPKEIRIKVLRPDGRPAVGSALFSMMRFFPTFHSSDGGKTITADPGPLKWTIGAANVIRADATGTIQIPFTAFESQTDSPIGVRNAEDGTIAFLKPSAALLESGATTVMLKPTRKVRGTVHPDAEVPYFSPTVVLGPAGYLAKDGKFEFPIRVRDTFGGR